MIIALLRLGRHAQHVLGRVVEEAAPRGVVLRENDRPVGVLLRNDEETVCAGGERLSFDLNVGRGGEHRVLVRTGPPRTFLAGAESEVDQAPPDEIPPEPAPAIDALRAVPVRTAL